MRRRLCVEIGPKSEGHGVLKEKGAPPGQFKEKKAQQKFVTKEKLYKSRKWAKFEAP